MAAVDVRLGANCWRESSDMGRLRSTMRTLGATAVFVCALSFGGVSACHAAASKPSGTGNAGAQPCNDVCKAYLAWSDRVAAMLRPSSTTAQAAVHDRKPAGRTVHPRASQGRQSGLNSFAQFPVRRDTAAQSAETVRAAVAPSRSIDGIADRFPTTAGFVTALLAGTPGATNDAPENPVVAVTDAIHLTRETGTIGQAARGPDSGFAMLLLVALCILSALGFWAWARGKTQTA